MNIGVKQVLRLKYLLRNEKSRYEPFPKSKSKIILHNNFRSYFLCNTEEILTLAFLLRSMLIKLTISLKLAIYHELY